MATGKRARSTSPLDESAEPRGKRASKACQVCQSRKIRCDAMRTGIPCTNCKWYGHECVVPEGKRGERHNRVWNTSLVPRSTIPAEPLVRPENQTTADSSSTSAILEFLELDLPLGLPFCRPQNKARASPANAQKQSPGLPDYISPLPSRLTPADLGYLRNKGALVIPEPELRDALLQSFVLFVYPFMPVVDLGDLFTRIKDNNRKKTVSLMLFQAVMFAAVTHVDRHILTAHGYNSKREARKAFFDRVKLLYSLDCEVNQVTLAQSVLLMTHWYESPDNVKDTWHYMGVAASLTRAISMDRPPELSRGLLKRIWWSCYIRDRTVAISMRRPMRIREEEFDIPELELQDFDIGSWPKDFGGTLGTWEPERYVMLVKVSIALAGCCRCIAHILNCHYVATGGQVGATQETTIRLNPKRSASSPCGSIDCDEELETWYKTLPPELQWPKQGSPQLRLSLYDEAIALHVATLYGIYITSKSTLHRSLLGTHPAGSRLSSLSEKVVRGAAMKIVDLFHDLDAIGLIRYLSEAGIVILQPAIAAWLCDMKSSNPSAREAGAEHFRFCTGILDQLSDVFVSAQSVSLFVAAAARKVGIAVKGSSTGISNGNREDPTSVSSGMQERSAAQNFRRTMSLPATKVNRQLEEPTPYDAAASLIPCITMTSHEQALFTELATLSNPDDPVAERGISLDLIKARDPGELSLFDLGPPSEPGMNNGIQHYQDRSTDKASCDGLSPDFDLNAFSIPAEDGMWSEFCDLSLLLTN
ncbi:Zn(II)2Cys6 transcription factor [Aspergillus alliaceus]|uniref:Zn(II)2Cys6 transcription factor n=1 Tax=Petromyces alliaceus TaxID=209559 RepID=UPI0012A47329|nr:fungal-specific transcription factor domain-containing protein [Aspergillus alliaceus]KAB8227162.1 fungal-specific transcription factor domain-containing protein [Aspergillus alliaceus]